MGIFYSKQKIPKNLSVKNVKPFIPPVTKGRVIQCYDGDTITIAAYLHFRKSPLYKFHVRIFGIDCPEIRASNANEKKVAIIARDLLAEKIMGSIVELKNISLDKYGRLLAVVFFKNESIGDWLLEKNLAVSYDGGKKDPPEDWLDYYYHKEV